MQLFDFCRSVEHILFRRCVDRSCIRFVVCIQKIFHAESSYALIQESILMNSIQFRVVLNPWSRNYVYNAGFPLQSLCC